MTHKLDKYRHKLSKSTDDKKSEIYRQKIQHYLQQQLQKGGNVINFDEFQKRIFSWFERINENTEKKFPPQNRPDTHSATFMPILTLSYLLFNNDNYVPTNFLGYLFLYAELARMKILSKKFKIMFAAMMYSLHIFLKNGRSVGGKMQHNNLLSEYEKQGESMFNEERSEIGHIEGGSQTYFLYNSKFKQGIYYLDWVPTIVKDIASSDGDLFELFEKQINKYYSGDTSVYINRDMVFEDKKLTEINIDQFFRSVDSLFRNIRSEKVMSIPTDNDFGNISTFSLPLITISYLFIYSTNNIIDVSYLKYVGLYAELFSMDHESNKFKHFFENMLLVVAISLQKYLRKGGKLNNCNNEGKLCELSEEAIKNIMYDEGQDLTRIYEHLDDVYKNFFPFSMGDVISTASQLYSYYSLTKKQSPRINSSVHLEKITDIDCENYGINSIIPQNENGVYHNYEYNCKKAPLNNIVNKETQSDIINWQNGDMIEDIYIDKYHIDCENGSLTKLKMERDDGKMRYTYKCSADKLNVIVEKVTPGVKRDSNDNRTILKHKIECPKDMSLSYMKLERDMNDGKDDHYYRYRCGK
jgi:hypothetical protein